jgi:hypothetical protein
MVSGRERAHHLTPLQPARLHLTGIDHVFMNISWSASDEVIEVIHRLAAEHILVLYDPQDDTVYLPMA